MAKWPYSDPRWPKLRHRQLSDEPWCRYCLDVGDITPATVADHVKRVRDRPDLAFDGSNLMSLCASCHSGTKHSEEVRGHAIGCDVDGNPKGGWGA